MPVYDYDKTRLEGYTPDSGYGPTCEAGVQTIILKKLVGPKQQKDGGWFYMLIFVGMKNGGEGSVYLSAVGPEGGINMQKKPGSKKLSSTVVAMDYFFKALSDDSGIYEINDIFGSPIRADITVDDKGYAGINFKADNPWPCTEDEKMEAAKWMTANGSTSFP